MQITTTLVNQATLATLATIYNAVSDSQVSRFTEAATARERVLGVLAAHGYVLRDKQSDAAVAEADGLWVYVRGTAPRKTVAAGTRTDWKDDMVVTVLAAANPKRPSGKSYRRFALYHDGMTVAEYKDACVKLEGDDAREPHGYLADLKWDTDRGFIRVDAPAEEPAAEPVALEAAE